MINNLLRDLRLKADLSQKDLANISQVGKTTISEIENMTIRNPSVETAIRLAHALNVSVEDIFKLN